MAFEQEFDLGLVTAYAYAVSKGYTGTEEEFAALMASYATVAEEAAESAEAAAGSAAEAAGSASTAVAKAGEAASDAAAAAGSAAAAGQAQGAAETAQEAAETAQGKAEDAQEAAEAAQGKTEDAQEAAETAQGKAEDAQSAAEAAQTAAEIAQTAAEAAQTAAEDAQEAAEAAAEAAEETLNSYAKVDGSYSSMTVGNAEQLVATVGVEDSVPYNFRTSGGAADIGDRAMDRIVGGTLVWNQMVDGAATSVALASGHRYVARIGDTWAILTGAGSAIPVTGGADVAFDLTRMFGAAIADYVYGLEQANAGAGVAWFRKLFPRPYYACNPGELMSVQAAAHRMVGFNAFDGGLENGDINETTGQNSGTSSSRTRCVNYIPVVPGAKYYFHTPGHSGNFRLFYYDADKNYINFNSVPSNAAVQIRADTHYIRFRFGAGRIPEDSYVCINLSWDGERDGEYEPYAEYTYPLDDALTLRGIPRLDSGNGLYYDGDTYESDGTVTRRYGAYVLDGVNNAIAAVAQVPDDSDFANLRGKYYAHTGLTGTVYNSANFLCQWPYFRYTNRRSAVPNSIYQDDSNGRVCIVFDDITTVEAANQYLKGLADAGHPFTIVYDLATPAAETADPFQSPQIVDDFGTEEYVDAAVAAETRDVAVPVGHDTLYQANLRAKLEMSPDSPDGDGDYIVRQANGQNEYVPLMRELPAAPTTAGTYHLKATVTSGGVTLTWEVDA